MYKTHNYVERRGRLIIGKMNMLDFCAKLDPNVV